MDVASQADPYLFPEGTTFDTYFLA